MAQLSKHLKQAYLAAVDASDYVLAAWVIQQWEDNLWTVDKPFLKVENITAAGSRHLAIRPHRSGTRPW